MLSSEHPSGPSCSSKSAAPGVSADPERSPSEVPACQDPADLVQPCPKFSIRDYVFASRSKSIKRSWPFRPQSLQLCLKRGVKDLLPPFEPPDLIRARSLSTCIDLQQSAVCSEGDASVGLVKTIDANSSNLNTSDIKFQSFCPADDSPGLSQYTPPEDGKSTIDQGENINESARTDEAIPVDLPDNSCTKASRETEFAVPPWRSKNLDTLRELSEKKCKFVVKLGSLTDTRRGEDVASNSSTVSDPMASKTCPVCKVFASTSNTTLNAHIDQCLSVESNTEQIETVFLKPKVKPRKKRLMVDIYKTALPYTLQDLDRRNGTNWAMELAMPTMNKEVCTENRSPEVVPLDTRDDEREGDVYVDSHGIKIRILSKSSDVPLALRDELGSRKIAKHETGKSILISKKFFKSRFLKNKKLKVHGKKYGKLNLLNSQVQTYPDGGINEDTSDEEEPALPKRKTTESSSHGGSETIRQWVCSKRSDLTKNFSRKLTDKTFDNIIPVAQKLARRSMLDSDDSRIPESPIQTFTSLSPEEMATTSEANADDQRKGSSRLLRSMPKWSSKVPSSSSLMLKVPRSAAALAKRKIKEIGRREAYKSDTYDMMRNSTSEKGSPARSLSFSMAGLRDDPSQGASTSKKFRKHRSLLRPGRREFAPSITGLGHGFGENHEPNTRHANKKFKVSNNDGSRKAVKHTLEDTADNDFCYGSDVPTLGQGDDQYEVTKQAAGMPLGSEDEEPETEMQCGSASRSNPVDCCNEISTSSLSPGNNKTADHAVLAEGYSEAMEGRCSSEQLMHYAHVSNIVSNNDTEEWQVGPASTKESSGCLTNNRDMGVGAPQDNSSITSNREDSNHNHGLAFDRDSSDSPISTASTMSPPTALKDSKIRESEPGPSTVNIRGVEDRNSGSLNQDTKVVPLGREGEQTPNDKPFCCSCRESFSRESQLHQQSGTSRLMPTFNGKQVPQLHIGLRASSSFSTYQRTNTKANSCLDSHDQPLTAKVSAESTMNLPSYSTDCLSPSLPTQLPSPSNPILRLMGKNLMVMNSEDSGHPQAPSSDYILRGNYMAPLGFVPPNYQHLGDSAFINPGPSTASHQIPLPSAQPGSFVGPQLHNGPMVQSDHHSQQKPYRNLVPVLHHPAYMMKEVIMINDSPERRSEPQVSVLLPTAPSPTTISVSNTMPPRPFFCLPSPSQILPRETSVGSMPVFANIGPMVGVSSTSQGSNSEVASPFMSNPFFVQSPTGYLNPSVYYPQNLR